MSVYDRLSGDKKTPPESRKHRRELKFGRYDYYVEEEKSRDQDQQKEKRSAADVEAIVERLRQDIHRNGAQQQQQQQHTHRTVSEAEAREIFDRLKQCDYTRWPVESRVGRHELGQNRYDFYRGSGGGDASSRKGVSKAELETIVGRLSTYDVAKTPPNSRALEIKQAKAAGGAA